ncbi:MAG: YihY family inner membrane protein [Sphaerochaetaceae bacterium]|nr:YihY family inner membrane protein [Sphaerochaetaceae bacterium]
MPKKTVKDNVSRRKGLIRFAKSFAEQFSLDSASMLSNGMVYSTLVAIVPCLTFIYAVLNWFNVLDPVVSYLETFLVEVFGESQGANLVGYLNTFTQNAMSMGIVSILSFFVTFVLLIDKIYTVINRIYHTDKAGNLVTRYLKYAGAIIIGLVSVVFIIYFLGRFNALSLGGLFKLPELSRFERIFRGVMPLAMTFAAILGIIVVVPNCKVKLNSALIGSGVGTVGIWILFKIFRFVVMRSVKYSIIYGSLATLLFFFMFLSYLWKIFFSAVLIAYVHQCEFYGVEYKL